jgi:prepilin-type processing-associated H-X9-DG protein
MDSGEPAADGGRVSLKAVATLLLGLLSLVLCLNAVAGLPALVLGYLSLQEIYRSDGRVRGRRLAVAGMALGGLGTLLGVAGVGAILLQNARAKSERLQCQNNLRQIGQAIALFHDAKDHYPPALIPNPALPADRPDQHPSWLAAILPYLDLPRGAPSTGATTTARPSPAAQRARETYDRLDPAKAWDAPENRDAVATTIRRYVCPGAPERAPAGGPAWTSYVGIGGVGPGAAALPLDDPRAGFFGFTRLLTRDRLQAGRGTGATLVATETARDNGPWAAGGAATVRDVEPGQAPYGGPGRPFGGDHRGGFNILMADGTVTFRKDDISEDVLEAMARINVEK